MANPYSYSDRFRHIALNYLNESSTSTYSQVSSILAFQLLINAKIHSSILLGTKGELLHREQSHHAPAHKVSDQDSRAFNKVSSKLRETVNSLASLVTSPSPGSSSSTPVSSSNPSPVTSSYSDVSITT